MDKHTFPNIKQTFILILFYFLPPSLYLFLMVTFPQLLGINLPVLYLTINSIIAATAGLIPIIVYINKKSGDQFKWKVRLPNILTFILIAVIVLCVILFNSPLNNLRENIDKLFENRIYVVKFELSEFDLNKVILLFCTVLIAPIFEEILFRKQILSLLLRKNSPLVSIIISSLLFSIVHLRLNDLATLFIWGLIFGTLYYKTKSIELSILLHSLSNLSTFFIKYEFEEINRVLIIKQLLISIVSILLIILIIKYLNRIYSSIKVEHLKADDSEQNPGSSLISG